MSEAVAGAGFGRNISSQTAEILGELYWGSVPSGTQVNTSEAAIEAMKRFGRDPNAGMLPRLPSIPDSLIQKAIFGFNGAEGVEMTPGQYKEEMSRICKAEMDDLRKAMTMGSSSLMHVIYEDGVTYLYKRPYPIQALIPVEANKGKSVLWDVIGPYEFGSASFGTEDQPFTESDITNHNRLDTVKFMYSVGRVTKAAQLAGLSQVPARDMLAIRVDACQDALRALRERSILGVTRDITSTVNAFANAGTNEYKGLYELITTNTTTPCYVTSNGNSYDLIMKDLDTSYNTMVKYAMEPNLAVCDYRTFGIIRRGLMEYFRTEPVKEFVQGISKINLVFPNHPGLPLVPHPFLSQTATYGSIFLLDTRLISRRSLWQDMYEELAKVNLSQKFVISAAETLIDRSDVGDDTTGGGAPAYSLHGGVFSIA